MNYEHIAYIIIIIILMNSQKRFNKCMNNLSPFFCIKNILYIVININLILYLAWYDSDLVQYQKDLKENELEKVFTERASNVQQNDYSGMVISAVGEQLKHKQKNEPKPEWTEAVRQKKNEDYYNKLSKVRKEYKLFYINTNIVLYCI